MESPAKPAFFEYKAEVLSVQDPLSDHRIMRFKLLEPTEIDFVPGQFVQVLIDGHTKPASFSIASSPADKDEVELAFHTVGEITGVLSKMLPGMTCTLRGPLGRFTFTAEDGDVVALAGGVGITPFICALRFIRDLRLPNKYTLLYSGKKKENLLYFDELDEMRQRHDNLDVVFTTTREVSDEWTGETRRVDAAMITTHVPDYKERTFYMCGPKPFLETMGAILSELGVDDSKIRQEKW